jgi:hypothetical protein
LPEASVVEGEYSVKVKCPRRVVVVARYDRCTCSLSIGVEAEGNEIPSAVPVEDMAPGTKEAAVKAPEPMAVAAG